MFPTLLVALFGVLLISFQNCSNTEISSVSNRANLLDPGLPEPDPNPTPDLGNQSGGITSPDNVPALMTGYASFPGLVDPAGDSLFYAERSGSGFEISNGGSAKQWSYSTYVFVEEDAFSAKPEMTLISASAPTWFFSPGVNIYQLTEAAIRITSQGKLAVNLRDADLTYPTALQSETSRVDAETTNSVITNLGWYHVHVIYDSSNAVQNQRLRVYINGGALEPMTYLATGRSEIELDAETAFTHSRANLCLGMRCEYKTTYPDQPTWEDAVTNGLIKNELNPGGIPIDNSYYAVDMTLSEQFYGGMGYTTLATGHIVGWTDFFSTVSGETSLVLGASVDSEESGFSLELLDAVDVNNAVDTFENYTGGDNFSLIGSIVPTAVDP